MDESKRNDTAHALAQLEALQVTLSEFEPNLRVRPSFVDQYHQALEHLEATGADLDEYRIPESEIYTPTGYKPNPTISRAFLLMRVRAVRGYFALSDAINAVVLALAGGDWNRVRPEMGFAMPNRGEPA